MLMPERRQNTDHRQRRARALGFRAGGGEVAAQVLFQLQRGIPGEWAGRHVQFQVVLAQFRGERRIVQRVQHGGVGHRRPQLAVHQVQLDFEPDVLPGKGETPVRQHSGESVETTLDLSAVPSAIEGFARFRH
jgi:hypothetical protein